MNDQRDLLKQLHSLVALANRRGLYDAADYLIDRIREFEFRLRSDPQKRMDSIAEQMDMRLPGKR